MDKKYYSSRHSRLNRNYKKRSNNKPVNGTFLLRVNLCLGIAIIVIGCFDFIKSITVSYDIQPPSLNIPDEDLQVIGNYLQSRSNGKNEFYEISNSLSEFISIHDN